jgi:uroporphyrinogen-III synthase
LAGGSGDVRLIVTRPRDQAVPWVVALRERGVDAVALPLIDIAGSADDRPLRQAWAALAPPPALDAVMFVSANAVGAFFAAAPPGAAWPPGVRAAAPGPGTAAALRAAGVPGGSIVQPPADAPQFDSEHLWPELSRLDWRGRRVLVVRGEGGRDWLGERWQAAGAEVGHVEVYRRQAPTLGDDDRSVLAAALGDPAGHAWHFSSSQAVGHLVERIAPEVAWAAHAALATHPRIAATARDAGFGRVVECGSGLDAVVACLESWPAAVGVRR